MISGQSEHEISSRDVCCKCSIPHAPNEHTEVAEPALQTAHYQCKSCVMNHEQNTMFLAISEGIQSMDDSLVFESGVISIISSYAVGIVVQCSNAVEECDTEISISSRFDLDNSLCCNVDSDGNQIIVRTVDINTESDDVITSMCSHSYVYGKRRQIVCSKCTQHTNNGDGIMFVSATQMLMGTQGTEWSVFDPYSLEFSDHQHSD